jgi:Gluconate 2-dehydrogenase subunit 3
MNERKPDDQPDDGQKGELSRREWLLQLGEAAIVFGFSGSAAEVEAKAGAALSLLTPDLKALPPGLYAPSSAHMAHALTADERYVKIPPGSETDYVRPPEGPFNPSFFNQGEFRTMHRLIELILGAPPNAPAPGDEAARAETVGEIAEWMDLVLSQAGAVREAARQLSPEHRALAAAYYGRDEVAKLEGSDPGRVCHKGLSWVAAKSKELHGKSFLELSQLQQTGLLELLDNEKPFQAGGNAGFLAYLKAQTIRGFYTSRLGLKELGYKGNYFYVECPGCKPQGPS